MSAVLIPKQQPPAPVPRIELRSTKEGWVVALINHKGVEKCERGPEPKREAFDLARELGEFLAWPVRVMR